MSSLQLQESQIQNPEEVYTSTRHILADGATTTIHVARYARQEFRARVVTFVTATHLLDWCLENNQPEAMSGAFFSKGAGLCLGEIWVGGKQQQTEPFSSPWDGVRGTLDLCDDNILIGLRREFATQPQGDRLQAGPLLVRQCCSVVTESKATEGFSVATDQFDSDITDGRYPRAAIGYSDEFIWSVAVDGRGADDVGLTLEELADYMMTLGATDALNLDGGGSATLISGGELRNISRSNATTINPRGRQINSAIIFSAL